jgi:CRP-like cAMP-binding protein
VLNPTAKAVLSSLPERLSARLFADAKSCHLDAGDVLFAAGEAGNGCYRLERGLLKVIITSPQGEERILAILGPGEVAGEISIIDGRPRSASVIAIDDCDLTFISQQNFEKYISSPSVSTAPGRGIRQNVTAVTKRRFLLAKTGPGMAPVKMRHRSQPFFVC